MALSYGLTNPAAFKKGGESKLTPDLFKFYAVMPTRSTQTTAAGIRRPVLYTSMNGGVRWNLESETSGSTTHGFYDVNYGGNFYFDAHDTDADHGVLMALGHKSVSSSYGSYKARAGLSYPLRIANQSWEWSSVVSYSTANQPNREMCKCPSSDRYFCIKEGNEYVYNDNTWSTANWTITSFGTSGVILSDDGGFKHICVNPEKDHEALVSFATNDSNKYIRLYLCDLNDLSVLTDYTAITVGTKRKQTVYQYLSVDYLPNVGYLLFYNYPQNTNDGFKVRILRTYDEITGEKLPYDQYVLDSHDVVTVGGSSTKIVQSGAHGWYCPWTKEYFFVPNASQVFWTKDGINWNSSAVTSASTGTACVKFMTDSQSMIMATSGSNYYYSRNKGQTWVNDITLTPYGFNTNKSNDTVVLPFKCTNNIGIDTSSLTLGKTVNLTTGEITDSSVNFYLNDFIPVDPDTLYVFYGACKTPYNNISEKQKTFYNRIHYYDSNYNYISGREGYIIWTSGSGSSIGGREVPCLFTSPSNAAYARVSCNMSSVTATQAMVDSYNWYFAKEADFIAMTDYGDIVCN